jgi:hypothetical protein
MKKILVIEDEPEMRRSLTTVPCWWEKHVASRVLPRV